MEKILCIRSDRFGEFLLTLPAIKLIKVNYPESKIFLFAKKENIELIKGIDFIDQYLIFQEKDYVGFSGPIKLAKIFKSHKLSKAIVFNPKKEFHLATFLAKIPLRVGYDRKWGWCLNKKILDKKFLCLKHEVEYNIELASLICEKIFIPEIELKVDPAETLNFLNLEKNKKYIVLCPFSSNSSKTIDFLFWKKLIEEIKIIKKEIALIGDKQEEQSAKVFDDLKIYNIVGKLTLRNLATFLKYYCKLFIGVDSGPMHLASLFKIPVVALFKTSDSKRWGPYKTKSLIIKEESLDGFLEKIKNIISFILDNEDQ